MPLKRDVPLKSLVETNPYLKNQEVRAQLLAWAVSTSTSIETIHAIDPRAYIPVKADVLAKSRASDGSTVPTWRTVHRSSTQAFPAFTH